MCLPWSRTGKEEEGEGEEGGREGKGETEREEGEEGKGWGGVWPLAGLCGRPVQAPRSH